MNHINHHTTCEIYFDNNPSKKYYSGQMLSGAVVLKLLKQRTVKEIFLGVIGIVSCQWRVGTESKDNHSAGEVYLHEKISVVDAKAGTIIIPPGEYIYPFSCMLPRTLPTSVEGGAGHIQYKVVVYIDRPMHPYQLFQESFTVIKPLTVSEDTTLRNPFIMEKIKVFAQCFFFCGETEPIYITAQTPVTGYAPGETVQLHLKFENKSNRTFRNFRIQLVKHIKYHTSSASKSDEIVLVEQFCEGCLKKQCNDFKVNITIPPNVPPTDESSNVIKTTYRLQIQGSSGIFCEDLDVHFPITIITNPIVKNCEKDKNTMITQQPSPTNDVNKGSNTMITKQPSPTNNVTIPSTVSNVNADVMEHVPIMGYFRMPPPPLSHTCSKESVRL